MGAAFFVFVSFWLGFTARDLLIKWGVESVRANVRENPDHPCGVCGRGRSLE